MLVIQLREIINKEFALFLEHPNNNCTMDELFNNQDLIDVKGFAKKIKCPVYFEAALFDDDCPVLTGFAVYNLIQSKKEYKIFPNDSHLGESGEYSNLYKYIADQFLK